MEAVKKQRRPKIWGFLIKNVEYFKSVTTEKKRAITCKISARFVTSSPTTSAGEELFSVFVKNRKRKKIQHRNEITTFGFETFVGTVVLSQGDQYDENYGKKIAFKKAKKQMMLRNQEIYAIATKNALNMYQELKTCQKVIQENILDLTLEINKDKEKKYE